MNECQWQCPDCGEHNRREYEGLDECDKCGTEVATSYHPGLQDRLIVKWWRSDRIASESQRPPLAPLTCSAPIAVEIRKAIDSINRHIDYIDVQRGGYSDDVKQKAYKDRSKLVDALIAMVPNTEVCQSGEPATDDNLPME